jgi:dipeptidyl aminopeptidase/acylaminoacyl peptidase
MLKKLKAEGKTVPYLNFGKSGHGVFDEQGRTKIYTVLIEFLDDNIGSTK